MTCHVVVRKDAGQDGDCNDGAVGYLHECCNQGGKSKALNDKSAKVGNASIGDVADHSEEEKEVGFDIREGFADLVPFEMLRLKLSTRLLIDDDI